MVSDGISEKLFLETPCMIFQFPFIIIYQDWISKKDLAQKRHLIHHIQDISLKKNASDRMKQIS